MQQIVPICKREFLGYFRSPVAYVFLVVFLAATVIMAFFVGQFFEANEASLRSMFEFFPWLFLFLAPAICMRLWAEEKRSGTWELLFTLPVSTTEAVLGKFFAAWAFFSLAILLTIPMAVTVGYLGAPDWGPIITGYLGAILMAGAYLAICSLASALTRNQVISFVLSFIICLLLLFLGFGLITSFMATVLPVGLVDGISNFSFLTHYEAMMLGVIDSTDVLFFLLLSAIALTLNVLVLER